MPYDATLLRAVAPRFSGQNAVNQTRIIDAVGPVLASTLAQYAINTDLRVAHFVAQTCHEVAGYRTTEEFADGSAYEGRADLGNTQPGDGPRFKGRGLLQLTGRANYRTMGQTLGLPLEQHPEQAGDPVISLRIACEYWKSRSLNEHADYDDIRTVTHRVNGGQNGIDDRKANLAKAKTVLGLTTLTLPARPVLRNPVKNEQARALQVQLRLAGQQIGIIDGDFGGGTERAVKAFQKANGMAETGIADAAVWTALRKFL